MFSQLWAFLNKNFLSADPWKKLGLIYVYRLITVWYHSIVYVKILFFVRGQSWPTVQFHNYQYARFSLFWQNIAPAIFIIEKNAFVVLILCVDDSEKNIYCSSSSVGFTGLRVSKWAFSNVKTQSRHPSCFKMHISLEPNKISRQLFLCCNQNKNVQWENTILFITF